MLLILLTMLLSVSVGYAVTLITGQASSLYTIVGAGMILSIFLV